MRRLLHPQALTELGRLTGQPAENNLRNHNLAVTSLPAIRQAARTNPGALAWWMRLMNQPNELWRTSAQDRQLPPQYQPFVKPEPPENPGSPGPNLKPLTPVFPQHPGQIIQCARQDYLAQGGARWKSLASQPAEHIAQQLNRHGPQAAVRLSEALSEAAPAGQRQPGANLPMPNLNPPPEAPLTIKLMLLETRENLLELNPENRRLRRLLSAGHRPVSQQKRRHLEPAIRRAARNALRHYAGRPEPDRKERNKLSRKFEDLADYLAAEPEAAARAATWQGLNKASHRWHQELQLQTLREELKQEYQISPEELKGWPAPLTEWRSELGFTARTLTSAEALIRESLDLNHCVGGPAYAESCAEGLTRIVHLQPADNPKPGKGTTLELYLEAGRWRIGQHRGRHNRSATPQETKWAQALLKQWRQALN